ncbi:MAG: divalent-cation tolerance protein CutA [Thermodesulfobacteriota bacterium]
MNPHIIYITAPTMEEAGAIGRALVSQRLTACVNILENMRSIYWWEGEVESAEEVVLLAKTRASLVPEVVRKVTAMHSYECPCVVSVPLADGNPAFLEWIVEETKVPAG